MIKVVTDINANGVVVWMVVVMMIYGLVGKN